MVRTSTQNAVTARSQVPRVKWVQRRKTRMEGETSRNKQIPRAYIYIKLNVDDLMILVVDFYPNV